MLTLFLLTLLHINQETNRENKRKRKKIEMKIDMIGWKQHNKRLAEQQYDKSVKKERKEERTEKISGVLQRKRL